MLYNFVVLSRRLIAAAVRVGIVALIGLSAACTANDTGTDSAPIAVTASPTVTAFDRARLPFDAYTLTEDQFTDLDFATKLLAKSCMKRFGIEWDTGGRVSGPIMGRNYGLGLVDPVRAATFGYHPTPEEQRASDNSNDTGHGMTDEAAAVLFGPEEGQPALADVPDGGCYGEARRLLGFNMEDFVWLQMLGGESMQMTMEHPDALALVAQWSACMKAAGYDYAHPNDANNDQAWWQGESAGPSQREINTAVADVRCKTETNYVGVITAVLATVQQALVEENAHRLRTVRAGFDDAMRNAADILANPPT